MGQEIPKQFIMVEEKPIIIYTLESFSKKHPLIDRILVVCKKVGNKTLDAYAKEYHIDKLQWIIPGGNSGQESINNGVNFLKRTFKTQKILLLSMTEFVH